MALKASVIIPVFNEERTLLRVIKKVLSRQEVGEVIVVDDGSKDNSYNIALNLKDKKVRAFRHAENKGKGAAIREGISKAVCDVVIIQDADLELNPANYQKLIAPIINGKADFVIGNRWKNNNGFFLPKLGGRLLTSLTNILFLSNFQDAYCGYKVATLDVWKKLKLISARFEIEAEIVAKIAKKRLKVEQVDIDYSPRTYKQGKKIKAVDVWKGIITLLKVRFTD